MDSNSGQNEKDFVLYGRAFARLGELWTKTYNIVQHGLILESEGTDDEHEVTDE